MRFAHIHSKSGSALLPGDVESQAEFKAGQPEYSKRLRADLLIVPHHGSFTSSIPHFLARVTPELAVVSAGYLNRYGHPAQKIVARYKKRHIELLNTACHGEISIRMSTEGMVFSRLRQARQPFWRHQCREGRIN